MRKLLTANLCRLWMDKWFWLSVALMICAEGILCLSLSRQNTMPMDFVLFLSLQGIGILVSVFFSLFLGTEYGDGTIRNKIVVGHKRSNIYLSSFIVGVVAVTIIYLAGVLTGSVMGILFFDSPLYDITQIALGGIVGWFACISYIAIFNFIGMLSSNKAGTSILCILTAFILVIVGIVLYALLQGTPSATLLFLFEFNPVGQTIQAMLIDIASPWKLLLYALVLSSVLTGIGLGLFHKKDLK